MAPKPLRVVDVTSFFSTSCGGIKRYYNEKARFFDPQTVDCHLVVPGAQDSVKPLANGWLHELAGPTQMGNDSYRRFALDGRLARCLAELQPDVIEVASHYLLPSMVKRAIAAMPKKPAVVGFFHSHPRQVVQNITTMLPWGLGKDALASVTWRFLCWQHGAYDGTLVASQHIEEELRRRGVPNVRRVGLGVDVDTFRPLRGQSRPDPHWVTYAGRFTRDKELPLLLKAFDTVHARTGFGLRLVGEGPMRKRIDEHAKNRPWMKVQGFVASPLEMATLLAESAAVVVPSQTETFSFATAEALSSGTPVIGADQGAVRELVQNSGCGLTFRAGSDESLAGALEMLLMRSEAERHAMGERGRVHILQNLTWPHVVGRLTNAYHHAMTVVRNARPQVAAAGVDAAV